MANALLLGGGAPTLTLEAGALAALHEKGVRFDVVSTAGAGMLVGLLFIAPKGTSPRQALESTREMGVHDRIYDLFPVNFKVFHKPGAPADAYRLWLQSLPRLIPGQDLGSRLFADWMSLWFAALCPSDLSTRSLGLCDHAPWIDEVVDFDKLKNFPGEFYMNAYCLEDQRMDIFDKYEITPDHFRAALAFPFIYPPFKLNGKTYIEGSAIDTLCFHGVLEYYERREKKKDRLKPLDHIVIFDVLSSENIIREPRTLYEAWIQSIMIPLVEIAKDDIELFKHRHKHKWADRWGKDGEEFLLQVKFDIPKEHWPYVLDWSYSNLSKLYDIGYEAGLKFYEEHGEKLKRAAGPVAQAQTDAAAESAPSRPPPR
ncbi:MAG: patatin-like phospholipase family protein [Geminicoccaceae bacterium]